MLSWLTGLTENRVSVADTRAIEVFVNGSRRVVEETGTTLQSLTGIRLHGDHFATDLGALIDTEDAPLFEDRTVDMAPYLRFSYRF